MGDALAACAAALEARLPARVARDAPFGALTTWRVGGTAAVLVRVETVAELADVAAVLTPAVPRVVLGRGSNLLVADAGFRGLVVVLGTAFERVTFAATGTDSGVVTAGGATPLPVLARQSAAAGWSGLGFYVGIPGSVGGAVRMNAGGHGRETVEVLLDATVVDLAGAGEPVTLGCAELGLGYRASALGDDDVVVAARFAVTPGDREELRAELGEVVRWRTEHQPGGANAGSVFRNPPGDAAARLIDVECGLRGLRVGGAVVSEKHANFIQAERGATAADVHHLITLVRDRVEMTTGVRLVPEVHEIGFEPR
ncbi:MAG: UDP-N-acetylmuramate dehydrogenase [Acidimicrobiia bacterium]